MMANDLHAWRQRLGFSKAEAATALGISYSAYRYYEAGWRNGKPVEIPKRVALACAAVEQGLVTPRKD